MPVVLQNIFRFILLVLLQVLVMNNIQFLGYINPYIYILFILSLPYHTPGWFTLILAFGIGITIDIFSNTLGMHAFATILVAFLRKGIIKLFTSIEEGNNPTPSFHTFGVGAYIKYLILMVLIHHTVLFFLESLSFMHLWLVAGKIIFSSVVTILLLSGFQSLKLK